MVSRLLIGLVIVWLLGYPVFLKNVDLSGTVFAAPMFHVAVTVALIVFILLREGWRRLILKDTSRPVGINALIVVAVGLIAAGILYGIATRGYDVLVAKTGSPLAAAAALLVFLIALIYLWVRFGREPVARLLSNSDRETG